MVIDKIKKRIGGDIFVAGSVRQRPESHTPAGTCGKEKERISGDGRIWVFAGPHHGDRQKIQRSWSRTSGERCRKYTHI